MNAQEKISISIYPEIAAEMQPEALQRAIQRRIDAAQRRAALVRRRRMVAGVILATCTCIGGLGVLASTTRPVEMEKPEEAAIVETIVIEAEEPERWELTTEERMAVIGAVMATARGEDRVTKMAVAQAIRDTVLAEQKTVSEVLQDYRYPNYTGEASDEATEAVEAIVSGEDAVPDVSLRAMYNPDVQSGAWHEGTENFICQLGSLKFFGVEEK